MYSWLKNILEIIICMASRAGYSYIFTVDVVRGNQILAIKQENKSINILKKLYLVYIEID